MARDPVCGMEVDELQASDTSQHKGHRYYFCSSGCRSEFDRNPEQYAGGSMRMNPQSSQRSFGQGRQHQQETGTSGKRRKAS